jgi:replication-associated recombination protein RarA
MKLSEKYRPRQLADIVGQPPVRILQNFCAAPYQRCFLFEGTGGIGKTTAALAMASELHVHEWDLHLVIGSELSADKVRDLWHGPLQNMPMTPGAWKLLLIEELEFLSVQCCTFLKTGLEKKMPPSTIVVATSNGVGKLPAPLLQRFSRYTFRGDLSLLQASLPYLQKVWQLEAPDHPFPESAASWGWDDDAQTYSLRSALDAMQDYLELACV